MEEQMEREEMKILVKECVVEVICDAVRWVFWRVLIPLALMVAAYRWGHKNLVDKLF